MTEEASETSHRTSFEVKTSKTRNTRRRRTGHRRITSNSSRKTTATCRKRFSRSETFEPNALPQNPPPASVYLHRLCCSHGADAFDCTQFRTLAEKSSRDEFGVSVEFAPTEKVAWAASALRTRTRSCYRPAIPKLLFGNRIFDGSHRTSTGNRSRWSCGPRRVLDGRTGRRCVWPHTGRPQILDQYDHRLVLAMSQ